MGRFNQTTRAMVLAAGRGERLRPLTDHVPKPLLQVNGETLIGRHLCALSSAGITDAVINHAWRGSLIRRLIGDGSRYGLRLHYSDEGERALETGGGIFRALPQLGAEPFLLVNADVWTGFDPSALEPPAAGDLASLVLVANPPGNPGGDFALAGDRVSLTGERLTYSGLAILHPGLFAGCVAGKFPLAPLLRRAIGEGRVRGQRFDGAWFDCGSPDSLAAARRYARGG